MAPKFCCCLPLRLGTLIISFIQFLLCGAAAGGFWFLLWAANERGLLESLENSARISLIVAGVIYTLAALIGLFGFFGSIFKKNGLVRTYLALLYLTLILEIASGVFSLVMFYRFRDGKRPDCVKKVPVNNGVATVDYCAALDNFANLPVWSVWVSSLVPILIVAYACYVVHNYTRRLAKQRADREIIATRSFATGSEYTAVKPEEEAHPLTQPPTYSYPYSDAPHSFGHSDPPATGHAASYYYSDNQNKV